MCNEQRATQEILTVLERQALPEGIAAMLPKEEGKRQGLLRHFAAHIAIWHANELRRREEALEEMHAEKREALHYVEK